MGDPNLYSMYLALLQTSCAMKVCMIQLRGIFITMTSDYFVMQLQWAVMAIFLDNHLCMCGSRHSVLHEKGAGHL